MLLCLTTVIGCTLCTLRYSCVWRMYPSHWLYPLYSKILLCLTYVSQSLVVPSVLEDAPVFDDSHWLYPLHSKILLCLTYVSQSLVVPSVLEDAPVFDVCIPVIGCTLCTRRYSCVWRMYPSHWLYPLYSKMLLCLTTVIGCTLCTLRCSCVWRMYPSHWLYPLHSKMLLCLTYVSQSLVVPSTLEDAPVFDVCIPVIGCTLCTRRCSCVWRMYPSHWLYPLHSKMLLCLTYVSQSLVVPSTLEDTPVFDVCIPVIGCTLCTRRCSCVWRMYPSHWLYPLHSKILLCLTYVSQSLVVPSVLEDAPVFDVCIPVIGCTLCTRRCSCVWRMYPSHWLYPLHSKMLLCLTYVSQSLVVPSVLEDAPVFDVCIPVIGCTLCTRRCSCVWRHWLYPLHSRSPVFDVCIPVIGCTLCTRRCSCVWRMYPSHWLYPLYSKMLLCLTYVSQSLVVPSVLEDAPVFDDVSQCTQSLVVPSVLEDTPVFDSCVPSVRLYPLTRSCVWRMYPSHWLYPLHSKMLLCLTTVIGCTLCTLRYSCVWRMYPSHWLYPLYSKILLCLTYVSQSLVVPSVLEDTPVFDVCIPDIGCTLCTRRCSCVWRQSLVVPSLLEDAPVFDDSHWLYPLHSKILLCLTYVSQSLVVPSVLEDAPVFDVCIPVIGCTLCTRRYSCVWRMYPSHWLYPLYSKMLMCLTTVIGCTLCTLRCSCVWRMYPSHWLYPLYSKILLCLTYVSQSLVVPSVL